MTHITFLSAFLNGSAAFSALATPTTQRSICWSKLGQYYSCHIFSGFIMKKQTPLMCIFSKKNQKNAHPPSNSPYSTFCKRWKRHRFYCDIVLRDLVKFTLLSWPFVGKKRSWEKREISQISKKFTTLPSASFGTFFFADWPLYCQGEICFFNFCKFIIPAHLWKLKMQLFFNTFFVHFLGAKN